MRPTLPPSAAPNAARPSARPSPPTRRYSAHRSTALKAELIPIRDRIQRLNVNSKLIYIVGDPTQLAPGPGLVVGGKLGDLIPQAEADLAELERQISQAETDLAALDS